MKKLFISFFLMIMLLNSCGEDTTQEAKDEFHKYYNGNNDVVLTIHNSYLHFEDYVIKTENLHKAIIETSITIYNKKIYFASVNSISNGHGIASIDFYSSDLFGENINKLYTKNINSKKRVKVLPNEYEYFIEYFNDDNKIIDKYNFIDNIYLNIDSGNNCNISDYIVKEENSVYSIEIEENLSIKKHGKFTIIKKNTGEVKIIDDEYLKNTIYIDSMNIYNYGPERYDISNGHILLTYGIGAGDGWNNAHLVFEYNFENNSLEYKLLAFPYDRVGVDIIYIGA